MRRPEDFTVGYGIIALDYAYTGKLPSVISNEIPSPLPFQIPASLKILRRCTLSLSDPGQNHRLSSLASTYDIFALRPTTEAALQQACQILECDIISFDLSQRFAFPFKQKTFSAAIQRGVKFEICYASGMLNTDGGASRRNLISNATQLIRATRGRGIVISSEAKSAFTCRAPADVTNLAILWGLPQDRANEAVTTEARYVAIQAEMKRRSFRGIIDIVSGGQPTYTREAKDFEESKEGRPEKRKAEDAVAPELSLSKREMKRRAKKVRLEKASADEGGVATGPKAQNSVTI